ncbi:MAG: Tetratricopeptide 2 repeat protein [Verrucomicrobiales bacterium]|nr:Tetratricopeptide 2 repeat protein [Verrucomicrobiales bacterium]
MSDSPTVSAKNDPLESEYQQLLLDDDAAQEEVDGWIKEASAQEENSTARQTLNLRVKQRLDKTRSAYKEFLLKNPTHARAHLAFGSFLNDIQEEEAAVDEWEKAKELDPAGSASWNNLANHYGHRGPVKKAFEYYQKAIDLAPNEPLYYGNYATTVYLFRQDAQEFFKISEDQVFAKALDLYRAAIKLDPTNFVLATDYAESFYGTKPPRYEEGLKAWNEALPKARDAVEREGVLIHLARVNINLGKLEAAKTNLNLVQNQMYAQLKTSLQRRIEKASTPEPGAEERPDRPIQK